MAEWTTKWLDAMNDFMRQTGGPAMPCERKGPAGETAFSPGMTVRDVFAALAMHALMVSEPRHPDQPFSMYIAETADTAYECADAMLARRTQ